VSSSRSSGTASAATLSSSSSSSRCLRRPRPWTLPPLPLSPFVLVLPRLPPTMMRSSRRGLSSSSSFSSSGAADQATNGEAKDNPNEQEQSLAAGAAAAPAVVVERVEEAPYDPSVPPEEPGAGECCGSDCRDCVYIEYWCVVIRGGGIDWVGVRVLDGAV
jgi:hypothetical protein